jgi:hypothetical protein
MLPVARKIRRRKVVSRDRGQIHILNEYRDLKEGLDVMI